MEQGEGMVITDVRIPFGRMVAIILKWTVASIPAILIIWLLMAVVALLFGGLAAVVGMAGSS